MRYVMHARIRPGQAAALRAALDDHSFGAGFPYGDLGENLRAASVDEHGAARWVETCYCREELNVAMKMELPYFEDYFHAVEVADARDPRFCDGYPHCNDCNCTDSIKLPGRPFMEFLDEMIEREKSAPASRSSAVPSRWLGWQGKVQTEEERQRNEAAVSKQGF